MRRASPNPLTEQSGDYRFSNAKLSAVSFLTQRSASQTWIDIVSNRFVSNCPAICLISILMHVLDQDGYRCRLCGQALPTESHARLDSNVILSVLIPVHDESDQIAQNLSLIHSEASKTGLPMEMIVVDDGSTDGTWQVLEKLAEQLPGLKALQLSRNFGKEAAICAGLAYSGGKACIVIDSDLQHPPEVIPEMVRLWRDEHWDIVEGIKRTRGTEPLINKLVRVFFIAL